MKFKLYSAIKRWNGEECINTVLNYFKEKGIALELSPIEEISLNYRDKDIYSLDWSWSFQTRKLVKSVKADVLKSLPHDGYDGVILFVDKSKSREDKGLLGQHHRSNGKSYIEAYVTDKFYKLYQGREKYTSNKKEAVRTQVSQTTLHELSHALSSHYNINDLLHVFIQEGQFESYAHYLKTNIKTMSNNTEIFYKTCLETLGKDITPLDEIPDEVGCAITVNAIFKKAFGKQIGGEASTYWLYDSLAKHPLFERVSKPEKGDIIISPTGYQARGGSISNGHVGIVGENGNIMSSNSYGVNKGLLTYNYTLDSWFDRYILKGKYPVYYFRLK